jgi:hypothetical protein
VAYENNDKKMESVYSKRVKAGKRRTYFFDVRETRGNDFFLTITESRKKFDSEGYDRHKIFLYKEDFNKFVKGLNEAVDHVKTELMPDFDFDAFSHEDYEEENGGGYHAGANTSAPQNEQPTSEAIENTAPEEKAAEQTPKTDESNQDNLADVPADKW